MIEYFIVIFNFKSSNDKRINKWLIFLSLNAFFFEVVDFCGEQVNGQFGMFTSLAVRDILITLSWSTFYLEKLILNFLEFFLSLIMMNSSLNGETCFGLKAKCLIDVIFCLWRVLSLQCMSLIRFSSKQVLTRVSICGIIWELYLGTWG